MTEKDIRDMEETPTGKKTGGAPAGKKKTGKKDVSAAAEALPFEAAATRLEEIVRALESGTLPLEESLALYEEGVALVRRCNRELTEAKQRVMVLRRAADGSIETVDFSSTDNQD